jgi:hypothetical protein
MMGTTHEHQYTSLIISRSFLLRMRKFQTNIVEKIKNFLCAITCVSLKNLVVYEIKRKNIVELERPQTTITHVARALHAVELRL